MVLLKLRFVLEATVQVMFALNALAVLRIKKQIKIDLKCIVSRKINKSTERALDFKCCRAFKLKDV